MNIHDSVTLDRVMAMVEDNESNLGSAGICIACGAEAEDVEPDARRCTCEGCGEKAVYGAEELLLMGVGQ